MEIALDLAGRHSFEGIVAKRKTAPHQGKTLGIEFRTPNYTRTEGRLELFEARWRERRSPAMIFRLMSLPNGQKLAHYEILEPIGRGGMGEVYRAKDSKLGRDVAIKVLPDEFARDEGRLRRFQREAKVLASLNHPNIASIYGLEQSGDTHYLVLELVPGETLAERIARGPIPIDEALEIATKIAEALEEAHERGVVHRDLKPANIKITEDGKIKVLDFGLAKAFLEEVQEGGAATSMSPTVTRDATRIGVILGTAAYMSPEQAKGKHVDKRTDIFAFGAVLFEMLSGKKAFPGDDVSEVLAAVIKLEPEWSVLPSNVSPRTREILSRCLEKVRRRRWRDIGDVRLELDVEGQRRPETDAGASRDSRKPWTAVALGVVFGAALVSAAAWLLWPSAEPSPGNGIVSRSVINLTDVPLGRRTLVGFDNPKVAISPDGAHIVYVGSYEAGTALFHRETSTYGVSLISGTEGAIHPFFSPDGDWVGYLTGERVHKVSLRGDPPLVLGELQTPIRASWCENDFIYVTHDGGGTLSRLSVTGGAPEPILDLDAVYPGAQWLSVSDVSRDGATALAVVSSRSSSTDYADIYSIALDTLDSNLLIQNGYGARFVANGHVVFARGGTLLAAPLERDFRSVTQDPVPLSDGVQMESMTGQVQFSVSDTGTLVYIPGGDFAIGKLAWVNRNGDVELLPVPEQTYVAPTVSPDGLSVAVDVADVNDFIWVWDVARREGRKLALGRNPVWSPDGRSLLFTSIDSKRQWRLVVQHMDETTAPHELRVSDSLERPSTWSPDGRTIGLYMESDLLGFLSVDEPSHLETVSNEGDGYRLFPSFSPDGRYVAYASTQTGRFEIWVRSFPDAHTVRQISVDGGLEPVWCENGELFYRAGDQWMVVRVSTTPELQWDPPKKLFRTDFIDTPALSYDVTPDGQRVLLMKRTEEADLTKLRLVTNWFRELSGGESMGN